MNTKFGKIFVKFVSMLLQEAVIQCVVLIFEDPGVQELIAKLYQKGSPLPSKTYKTN
jgi:hypothetical protein